MKGLNIILFASALLFSQCDGYDQLTGVDKETGLYWITLEQTPQVPNTFYLSPTGNDSLDGLTPNSAFLSLRHALTVIGDGSTLRLLPGVYEGGVAITGLNALSNGVKIEGYGGIATIEGNDSKTIGLMFEHSSHIELKNLIFTRFTDIGLLITQCSNVVIDSCQFLSNGKDAQLPKGWGVEGYGLNVELSSNILIQNSEANFNGPVPKVYPDRLMGTGFNTFGNSQLTLRNCLAHHNVGGGILVEDSDDVLIENNEIHSNDLDATQDQWWDGGIWLDGGKDVIIRGNYLHDNIGPGIEISNEDHQDPSGYILEDNISTNNLHGIFIWNFGTDSWPESSIISNVNNDFTGNTTQDVWIVDWY